MITSPIAAPFMAGETDPGYLEATIPTPATTVTRKNVAKNSAKSRRHSWRVSLKSLIRLTASSSNWSRMPGE